MISGIIEVSKVIYMFIYNILYYTLSFFITKQKYDYVIIARHMYNTKTFLELHPDKNIALISSNKRLVKYVKKYNETSKTTYFNKFTIFSQIIFILQTNEVIIDDYYAPLQIIDQGKTVTNIWHAYAVYKKIALQTPLYNRRNPMSIDRFYRNYQRINTMYVRSEIEAKIFEESYQINPNRIVIEPRYYETKFPKNVNQKERQKVVLYAPTHRSYSYHYDKVYKWLVHKFPDYEVKASYHQLSVKNDFKQLEQSYVPTHTIDRILRDAEIFVSDYSSLLIEVSTRFDHIQTYQMLDSDDYEKYIKIQGLNDKEYTQNIDKLYYKE